MEAEYKKYILKFKRPSGTSRGVLTTKETWFLKIKASGKIGYGECGILRGLSIDDRPDYEEKLQWVCAHINLGESILMKELREFPSIQIGVEMAFKSLQGSSPFELFPSEFTKGKSAIPINGLIWMGEKEYMKSQIEEKIEAGFQCIKLKIGAIDFKAELALLKYLRTEFSCQEIEIRVDANGAFKPEEASGKLNLLSNYNLHSIEQPIRQGQWSEMAVLCRNTPLPIALDEELIGVFDVTKKKELLQTISPHYIILKPSLIGGFKATQEWIDLAESLGIGWWITSALESNLGLNAISQFTFTRNNEMPQGLGTGSLYTNNFRSPLYIEKGHIHYKADIDWQFNF